MQSHPIYFLFSLPLYFTQYNIHDYRGMCMLYISKYDISFQVRSHIALSTPQQKKKGIFFASSSSSLHYTHSFSSQIDSRATAIDVYTADRQHNC